jgi:hypothetical protein
VHREAVKTSDSRLQEIRRERLDAIVDGRMGALFRRIPVLCGFSLQADLVPTEVTVYSWPGYVAGEQVYSDIIAALADVVTERPEAAELLRHRTFARRFH